MVAQMNANQLLTIEDEYDGVFYIYIYSACMSILVEVRMYCTQVCTAR